jgi:hypothetical protein
MIENSIPVSEPSHSKEAAQLFEAMLSAGSVTPEAEVMHALANGVYIKAMMLDQVGWTAVQHSHNYDHLTLVASGAVFVKVGDDVAAYDAPAVVFVKAHSVHKIMARLPNTVCYCIHRLNDGDDISSLIED